MSKVFRTIMSLLCAFTLVFCFSGCNIFNIGGTGNNPWFPPGGGSQWDGDKDPGEAEQDPEFSPGYFDEIIAQFVGVRLMHQPAAESQSGNDDTDAERVRFLSNVMEQYEVLAAYIILRLVGEFGMGVEGLEGAGITYTSANGDYSITVPAANPKTRIAWIWDNNMLAIQRSVVGWEFATDSGGNYIKDIDGKFVVIPKYNETKNSGHSWVIRLENGNYKSLSAQEYTQAYLSRALTYVQICLMQLDAGYAAMDYNQYNQDTAGSILLGFAKNYERLGLVLTDDAGNASQLGAIDKSTISQFILQKIIGSAAIEYNSSTKTFIEPFIDWNKNGNWDALLNEPIIPAEEFTDWNDNGEYDQREPFTDLNENGTRDEDEPFEDLNNNGVWDSGLDDTFADWNENGIWDSIINEPLDDWNGNGVRDTGIDEPLFSSLDDEEGLIFQDYNGNEERDTNIAEPLFSSLDEGLIFQDYNENGIWDAGEPIFRDYNGNGVWDSSLDEPIFRDYNGNGVRDTNIDETFTDWNGDDEWSSAISEPLINDWNGNGVRETGLSEPYIEANDNEVYDFESFIDYNENGFRDINLTEPFFDANKNGVRDANISTSTWFVREYQATAEAIADELAVLTNEPSDTPLFPSVWRLEVVDIAAADFFTPGIEETEGTVRKLDNMDYAQWQSALFVPKPGYQFDMLTLYIDAETSFGLTIYVKVNTADGYFVVPVCFMSLDHAKACDWENVEESSVLYDEIMDMPSANPEEEAAFDEAYRRIAFEDNFSKEIRRNAIAVEMDLVMEALQLGIVRGGFLGYDGTLEFFGRGYHTNKVDNAVLGNEYDKIELGEGNSTLAYCGAIQSFELLFEIYQPVTGQQYNFKFLAVGSIWGEEGDE